MEIEEQGLVRFWFEFDLSEHQPSQLERGAVQVDGGDVVYRLLHRGAGVTGYDELDCLSLLATALGEVSTAPLALPQTTSVSRNPAVDEGLATQVGNPAWRGVWFPPLNLRGPSLE
jgi:hypothetical protein